VTVVAAETPWGTHYKIKAYVTESREQFAMITDLTIRGKAQLRKMASPSPRLPMPKAQVFDDHHWYRASATTALTPQTGRLPTVRAQVAATRCLKRAGTRHWIPVILGLDDPTNRSDGDALFKRLSA